MTNFEHKMVLVEYSEKAVVMIGDTKEHKDDLKIMGGKFNVKLILDGKGLQAPLCDATVGWIFPKTDQSKLAQYLKDGECTAQPDRHSKRLLTGKSVSKHESPSTNIVLTRSAFDSVLARIAALECEVRALKGVGRRGGGETYDDIPVKSLRLLRPKK